VRPGKRNQSLRGSANADWNTIREKKLSGAVEGIGTKCEEKYVTGW
jgi:hypothetical protein